MAGIWSRTENHYPGIAQLLS